ncbi:hypothetical protein COCSADRAFT_346196 [Bipolaris sorokiniana ND90Pr]|uniref:Uncharacterized protein n=1 Tax=Cochliobolus sativus (strain ND90Pr / ATCC 201652) TaxID=665912 RepID=M2RXT1_COCSN|nr:uncharacterized protein COCSADRAFT_346196 [Bipolaris sorokiniana ND90Pr]EMD59873.1 hypothetical protein COCSADRAFT_346196 [Bipolaris sorokiniana ND90Pr]
MMHHSGFSTVLLSLLNSYLAEARPAPQANPPPCPTIVNLPEATLTLSPGPSNVVVNGFPDGATSTIEANGPAITIGPNSLSLNADNNVNLNGFVFLFSDDMCPKLVIPITNPDPVPGETTDVIPPIPGPTDTPPVDDNPEGTPIVPAPTPIPDPPENPEEPVDPPSDNPEDPPSDDPDLPVIPIPLPPPVDPIPLPDPSPVPEPIDPIPEPDPVEPIPEPDPVEPIPVPDPVDPIPAPDPVEPIPEPDPVEPIPVPDPVIPIPIPGPVIPIPVPDPVNPIPVPDPENPIPVPDPVNPIPVPDPVPDPVEPIDPTITPPPPPPNNEDPDDCETQTANVCTQGCSFGTNALGVTTTTSCKDPSCTATTACGVSDSTTTTTIEAPACTLDLTDGLVPGYPFPVDGDGPLPRADAPPNVPAPADPQPTPSEPVDPAPEPTDVPVEPPQEPEPQPEPEPEPEPQPQPGPSPTDQVYHAGKLTAGDGTESIVIYRNPRDSFLNVCTDTPFYKESTLVGLSKLFDIPDSDYKNCDFVGIGSDPLGIYCEGKERLPCVVTEGSSLEMCLAGNADTFSVTWKCNE